MVLRQTSIFKVRHYFINDVAIYPNIQWFKTHTHIFRVHQELICIHVYVCIQDSKAHLIFETWDTTLSSMHPNIQWIKIHIHFQGISNAKIYPFICIHPRLLEITVCIQEFRTQTNFEFYFLIMYPHFSTMQIYPMIQYTLRSWK